MDIPFPSQLQWVTPFLGSHWPQGSESAWWRSAGYLRAHAAALETLIPDLQTVGSKTRAALVGETAAAFDEQFAQAFAGNTALDKAVAALRSQAEAAEMLGTQIQYTKLSIISMLVIAAASIVFALANSEWTLGASLAQIPVIRWLTENAITRLVTMVLGRIEAELAARLGSALVARLVIEGAVSAGIGAAQEGSIEAIQVAEGHRDGIDVGQVLHSALSMGAAGVAGGWAGHEVGALLGTQGSIAMRALQGAVTGLASAEAANVAGTVVGGGNVGADTLLGGAIGVVHGLGGRNLAVVATQVAHFACASSVLRRSAGVCQSRVLRGRALSSAATAASASARCTDRSVPFGKYWRSSPFVFSFDPRCHGLL